LKSYLQELKAHGGSGDMLLMTVSTTNDTLAANRTPSDLTVDYLHGQSSSLYSSLRFKLLFRQKGFRTSLERWGRERVSRAHVGLDVDRAADLFDFVFGRMFGHFGPYALQFRPFGWTPSNNSLERSRD
jgi:hypothetical protein